MKTEVNIDKLVKLYSPILVMIKKDKENGRKCGKKQGISNKYCLWYILVVLKSGIPWSDLRYHKLKCHYLTIQKRYYKWVKKGFFSTFHSFLQLRYIFYINNIDPQIMFFIDSTDIRNNCGTSEFIGFGQKFKNKGAIKLTIICDKNQIIYSMCMLSANIHDIIPMLDLVENSSIPIYGTYRCPHYLGADKAYTSIEYTEFFKKKNLILTCPVKEYDNGIIKNKKLDKQITKLEKGKTKLQVHFKKQLKDQQKQKIKLQEKQIKLKKQIENQSTITNIQKQTYTKITKLQKQTQSQIIKLQNKTQKIKLQKRNQLLKLQKRIKKLHINIKKPKPPKKHVRLSKIKKEVLRMRSKVEHCFNHLKRGYKRIDRYYERNSDYYMEFVKIANSINILNYFQSVSINI
jgi:hypothetical protein